MYRIENWLEGKGSKWHAALTNCWSAFWKYYLMSLQLLFRAINWTYGHTSQFSQSRQSRSRSWPNTQCPIAQTWESAPKQWTVMAIVEARSPTLEKVLRWLIGCISFFWCGINTKTHFEWLLWHWSSLGQLNLKPTRPNGLVGCKVPTDLVKISVK